jgi:hypothetical protein
MFLRKPLSTFRGYKFEGRRRAEWKDGDILIMTHPYAKLSPRNTGKHFSPAYITFPLRCKSADDSFRLLSGIALGSTYFCTGFPDEERY